MKLHDRWVEYLCTMPETGMGYHIVDVELKDGRVFKQAVVDSGYLTRIRNRDDIPFLESDIADMRVTHEKWNWRAES